MLRKAGEYIPVEKRRKNSKNSFRDTYEYYTVCRQHEPNIDSPVTDFLPTRSVAKRKSIQNWNEQVMAILNGTCTSPQVEAAMKNAKEKGTQQ